MQKAHIIFAHPNLASFNGKMRNKAKETLEKAGLTVTANDLYQMNFKASADSADFTALTNPDFFDLQQEQAQANNNGTFTEDIKQEQQLLAEADLLIFQFPLYWYSMPALLKGYFDRMFSVGWAYGGGNALEGKTALVSTSTGAPEFMWTTDQKGEIKTILMHLTQGTLAFCGMKVPEPFIVYGAKRLSDSDKAQVFEQYAAYLKNLVG